MEAYQEILDRMNAAYKEKSGSSPRDVSDIGLRLRVLAGEIYRLQARIEWLERQAFPHTADGKYLDLHGAQRGVERGGGGRASGVLSFSRYVPVSFDLVVPKGTVCASYGGEAVEYETTEDAVLSAGEVTATVPARAVEAGSQGNAAAGYINTLVDQVNGIEYVTNTAAFTGGSDQESDEDYRKRILDGISRLEGYGSPGYYERTALEQEGVFSAQAVGDGVGNVNVYIWGSGAAPESGVLEKTAQALEKVRPVGAALTVKQAATKRIMVACYLTMRTGASFAQAKTAVTAALNQWFAGKGVGDPALLSDINRVVLDADPAIAKVVFTDASKGFDGGEGIVPTAGIINITESAP